MVIGSSGAFSWADETAVALALRGIASVGNP